ncbi:hypothetical protein EDD29_4855 [Actinocorallia herbida]|uniref:Tetratricopeptide repeat protein n=1 Tax=Actinocorallia herbida TaxID=58109 RepID=A0A3N1D180_9ACTN|nr:hypothetical protein [Actinocorallia herbida]ROO87260.1 hypothetical protein EDD29_4855 [Actinocorallia herbida]
MYLVEFEEILEAVGGRIGRWVEKRDSADLLLRAGVRDAEALQSVVQAMPRSRRGVPPREPWLRAVTMAGLLFYARHVAGGDESDAREAERLLDTARERGGAEPLRAKAEIDAAALEPPVLGNAKNLDPLNRRAILTPQDAPLAWIDENAALLRHAMAAGGGLDLRVYESNLISLLSARYGRTGHLDDLGEAIELAESLVERTEPVHDAYARRLSSLAWLRQLAFTGNGDPEAFDEAVKLLRSAVRHTPADHEDHAMHLANLGRSLRLYHQTIPGPEVIAESVELLERAVAATADDEHPSTHATRRGELAVALAVSFAESGDPAHLEAATQRIHEAWALTPGNDHNIPDRLYEMSWIHRLRYEAGGHPADKRTARRAAKALRKVVPRGDPLREQAQRILREI